ncbi:MAG: BatD family protein [Pseudomonadales bacterium]
MVSNKFSIHVVATRALHFLFLICFSGSLYAGTLTATVDSTQLSRNETLTLTLQYDERTSDKPDTRELEQSFNIRRQGSSSSMRIINGDYSSTTTWEYELSPKRTGKLLIPSFSIGQDFSEAISIDVAEKSSNATQTDQPLYTETSLDKKQVYSQQQAIITWRLISRMGAPQVRLAPPQISGVLIQNLGDRSFQRTGSNGRSEWVIELRYAIFPQQSGSITIPSQTFQAFVNQPQHHSSGFIISTPTEITRDTEEQQLEVLSPPDTQGKNWLPATSLEVMQQITGLNSNTQATVGTAFTRTVRTRAKGLSAEQLPAFDMQASNVKAYPEKPSFENKAGTQGNIGTREDRAAIIATQPGKLVLPAVQIPWYDTEAAQWRTAELPESTIEVLPNPNASTQPPPASTPPVVPSTVPDTSEPAAIPAASAPLPHSSSNSTASTALLWPIAVVVLLLSLILLAVYTLRLQLRVRQQNIGELPTTSSNSTSKQATINERDIEQAVQHADYHTAYRLLSQWTHQLNAMDNPSIQAALQIIEKHLYGNGAAPSPDAIQALFAQLAQQSKAAVNNKTTKHSKEIQLGDLY